MILWAIFSFFSFFLRTRKGQAREIFSSYISVLGSDFYPLVMTLPPVAKVIPSTHCTCPLQVSLYPYLFHRRKEKSLFWFKSTNPHCPNLSCFQKKHLFDFNLGDAEALLAFIIQNKSHMLCRNVFFHAE